MTEKEYEIKDGWCVGARHRESPNFDPRPADEVVDLLVIHAISLPPGQYGGPYIDQFFLNKLVTTDHPYFTEIESLRVSSHFVVNREGTVYQYVSVDDRAWHCGESKFDGREKCNDFSVGIELEGCDEESYTEDQYNSLRLLSLSVMDYFPAITTERIAGHCDIAPTRKTDPGPLFDWQRFQRDLVAS